MDRSSPPVVAAFHECRSGAASERRPPGACWSSQAVVSSAGTGTPASHGSGSAGHVRELSFPALPEEQRWPTEQPRCGLGEERDVAGEEPERPGDVGDRRKPCGESPAGALVAADELQRAEHEDGPDDDAEDADPGWGGGGLREGDAAEGGPGAGERVAEVLADGEPEVAVEGLKDDVDGLAASPRWRRGRRRRRRDRGRGTASARARGTGRVRRARRVSCSRPGAWGRRRRWRWRAGRRARPGARR